MHPGVARKPERRRSRDPLGACCSDFSAGVVAGAGAAKATWRSKNESRPAMKNCMFAAWIVLREVFEEVCRLG